MQWVPKKVCFWSEHTKNHTGASKKKKEMKYWWILLALLLGIKVSAQDYTTFEWEMYDTTNSILPDNWVSDVLVGMDGTIYFSTMRNGFFRLTDQQLTAIPVPVEYHNYWLKDLEWWDEDRILIAGMNEQMLLYNTRTKTFEPIGLTSQIMYARGNHLGNFLFATHIGNHYPVFQIRDGQRAGFGRGHQDVMGLYIAPNGDAMISYRDGTFVYPMAEDGTYAAENDCLTNLAFYDLELDSEGNLWATSLYGSETA
jgi:outer membrane protein assembly factor BamB